MSRYIVSITSDRSPGGIANSLLTYSRAMATAGLRHIIIVPHRASIVPQLEGLENVDVIKISRLTLRLLLLCRFLPSPYFRRLFDGASLIFIHNARHIGSFAAWPKQAMAINHTGKLRHLTKAPRIIFLNHTAQARFHDAHQEYDGVSCVIHHAFDLPETTYLARPAASPVRIVSAGRLLIKKGFHILIEAAAILAAKNIPCHIRIYGAGDDGEALQAQIDRLQLSNIEIHPWVADLHVALLAADIFCLPSQGESFPLVIGEAMQAGLPIVSTRTDGMMDYVARCEAPFSLLCDIDDGEGLAAQLATLVLDGDQRTLYGRTAFAMAQQHFSLRRLGQDFEHLILTPQK